MVIVHGYCTLEPYSYVILASDSCNTYGQTGAMTQLQRDGVEIPDSEH